MNLRYQDAETKDKLNLIKNILNGREDYQDKLQNNWNELKKWLEECLNGIKQNDVYDRTSYEQGQVIALESSVAKMQELEQVKRTTWIGG